MGKQVDSMNEIKSGKYYHRSDPRNQRNRIRDLWLLHSSAARMKKTRGVSISLGRKKAERAKKDQGGQHREVRRRKFSMEGKGGSSTND